MPPLSSILEYHCLYLHTEEISLETYVKLRPLLQPQLRVRTYAETNPSAQRSTQLRSVLARVYSV
jgi:hypothetical protein